MSDHDLSRDDEAAPTADVPAPGADVDLAAALAAAQQRALEQDLRIADLDRTIEHLRGERAALQARLRPGPRARADRILQTATEFVRARQKTLPGPLAPGLSLAALPVALGSARPTWDLVVDILGDVRPALRADPPLELSWDVDLPAGSAVRGAVTLRPGAWSANRGGVELVVELRTLDGALVGSLVKAVNPAARAMHRRWVPWHFPLPAAGRHRLTLHTRIPKGATPDYAWAVIADPVIELPGLPPRAGSASPGLHGSSASSGVGPTIALLLPVHDPDPSLLDRTLEAVLAQTSSNWELCIVDDGSSDPLVRDRLARAAQDARVRLVRHDQAQGISGATNAAMGVATAEFVATLDHDDVLAPDAVEVVSAFLHDHPDTDLVYSDNDLLAGNHRFSASLKPDWSPDLLRSVMYTLHFSAYRRSVVEAVGGWRSAFDGAQDHDLVLRLSERTDRIRHLPRVLYHWRAHAGSAALGELAKPLAYDRGRAAIAEHLVRTGHAGAVAERLPQAGRYRARYPRTKPVTVFVAVRGDAADDGLVDGLRALLATLREGDAIKLVSIGAATAQEAAAAARDAIGDPRLQHNSAALHEADGPTPLDALFTPATLENQDRIAVFFERAAAPTDPGAIDELAGHVEAGAAAAGGIITAPGGRLASGGIAFPQGLPIPLHPDAELDGEHEPHPALTMVSNRLALRGVIAVACAEVRPLIDAMRAATPSAGKASRTPTLAFAGLTLAASERGGRVVWSPHARFEATELAAADLSVQPLGETILLDRGTRPDPFWNPLRWPDRGDETVPEAVHENPVPDGIDL